MSHRVVDSTPKGELLRFERQLLEATASVLEPSDAELLRKQVECINKVQRLLDWKEIEFYCMRWFRVNWPKALLFSRKDEFRLATVDCKFGEKAASVAVWAVGGHVFSLESKVGLSGLSIAGPMSIAEVRR